MTGLRHSCCSSSEIVICLVRWPKTVTTHYFTTYFELLRTHFKLCTTHSKFFETNFELTTNSEIFTTHFIMFTTHSPQDPRCWQREKGTGTQLLLLLPLTPCFVPRVDNNYKKVFFFFFLPEMWTRKISSKDTFWLVLSTTPLLASLKSSMVFTFCSQH